MACMKQRHSLSGDSSNTTNFSRQLSVRYLSGIFELSTFWDSRHYQRHRLFMGKFLKASRKLVEDLGIECYTPPHTVIQSPPIFSDADGVDNLILAILTGIETV